MQEILPLAGIVVVLVLIAVLAFHVKKQRDNHIQLFVYMYGTILEGRLRNLIVCLEDALGNNGDVIPFVDEGWAQLSDPSLCNDLRWLAEQNGLGGRDKKALEYGCDCIASAVALMPRIVKTGEGSMFSAMPPEVHQQWRQWLLAAIDAFETVRRNTVF